MEKFYSVFSLLILFAVIMTIISSNPIHSVFWLVLVFLETASLFIILGYEFLGLMLIIIYVGAITILFLFVIMLLNLFIILGYEFLGLMLIIIYVGAITILFLFVIMMLDVLQLKKVYNIFHLFPMVLIILSQFIGTWGGIEFFNQINYVWEFIFNQQINSLGLTLYSDFGLPFLLISILLLIAMVGAIVLTLENSFLTKFQSLSNQHHRNNSWV
uniref:NADH-ubiquinone oxidoreductase chain 6 n=1 Tax=Spirocodon saltatrix TaxID=6093 RepID=A0A7D5NK70_9CNID|nr:NADH dehydrogenase subunit 6 [Spirocodon saltatrix]QLH56859.1 NADH dehydrogenase subunit 6 [Spirocodon saltatrix]